MPLGGARRDRKVTEKELSSFCKGTPDGGDEWYHSAVATPGCF